MDQFSKTASLWLRQYIVYSTSATLHGGEQCLQRLESLFSVETQRAARQRDPSPRGDSEKRCLGDACLCSPAPAFFFTALSHVSAPYWPEGFVNCPDFEVSGGLDCAPWYWPKCWNNANCPLYMGLHTESWILGTHSVCIHHYTVPK
jgi:hypothetical protein